MAAKTSLQLSSSQSQAPTTYGGVAGIPAFPVAGQVRPTLSALLFLEAWAHLAFFDVLSFCGYKYVNAFTKSRRTSRRDVGPDVIQRVCVAVEEACVWYVKRTYCLQRSSITSWMLRRRGIHAELVIGHRPIPLDSHAWVEVDGHVVNDRPEYKKFFQVLDRL